MKRILSALWAFLILPLVSFAQNPTSLDGWAQQLRAFGRSIPQEEVFVHLDNQAYYLGDTIYYKAYMRRSDGLPSRISRLLYVELLNQDGYLVERQKVEMIDGQGHGSIALLDTLYGGYYELRAYTRWQLNWGQTEHPHTRSAEDWFYSKRMARQYYRDWEKLYSRVFPVFDKPKQPGRYAEQMTVRPLQRYFRAKQEKPEAQITFFPEGGALIGGVEQRIAFEANDKETGEHLTGTLTVTDSKGTTLATAPVENRGRGSFMLTAQPGESYKATFRWSDGESTASLPKAEPEGIAMQASTTPEGIQLQLKMTGQAAQEPLGLTAQSHGCVLFFQELPEGKESTLQVPADSLRTGVVQLTLFNAEGRVWADRLVFWNDGTLQSQNIQFGGVNPEGYEPYAPIEVNLQGLPDATVSLAVRDSRHTAANFDSGNVLTEMLLCSQIRGFVEQPEYYFEKDDAERRRHLDLLLLVQGWRRYRWVEMATPGAFAVNHPYELSEWIYGSVNKYEAEEVDNEFAKAGREMMKEAKMDVNAEAVDSWAKEKKDIDIRFEEDMNHRGSTISTNASLSSERFYANHGSLKQEVLVHIEFMQPGVKNGSAVGEMPTYDGGLFRIQGPRFYEGCFMFVDASDSTKWKKGFVPTWIQSNEDKKGRLVYPEFYVKLDLPFPRFVKPYNFYQVNQPVITHAARQKAGWVDNVVVMKEVVIGANRNGMRNFDSTKPAFVLDAYDAFNAVVDAGLCPGYYMGSGRFCQDIARTFVGDMNMERAYDLEQRWDTRPSTANIPATQKDKYNQLTNLDKVYVYTDYSPRNEGSEHYSLSNQPRVTVDLRRFADGGQRMVWRNRRKKLTGFAVADEFYSPDYQSKPLGAPTDYRRTLYWKPDIRLDAEGKATVEFYNNSQQTRLDLSAEGMNAVGELLTGRQWAEEQ